MPTLDWIGKQAVVNHQRQVLFHLLLRVPELSVGDSGSGTLLVEGEMLINFECKRCHHVFDCDVGSVSVPEGSDRPHFENRLLCPTCGEVTIDDVWLTELGQSQLTEATLDFDDDFLDSEESQCQGCDRYLPVNDLNLCDECASKLDRDLIRERDWDYSTSAFGLDASKREELHRQVIAQYDRGCL